MNIINDIYKYSISTPYEVAVVCEGRSYSYSELFSIVEGLSAMLVKRFISKHDLVGVLSSRSELSVFLYLAILNIGAVYIPIDESLPHKRIEEICHDSRIKLLIGDDKVCNYKGNKSYEAITIPNNILDTLKDLNKLVQTAELASNDPSVILFTSGSTGTPKGVILPHECLYVCSHIDADRNAVTSKDNILTVLNFCFAFSLQYLQPLIKGATLFIGTDSIRSDFFTLRRYIESKSITVITMPTQMGHAFCEESVPASIRLVVVGGSALPPTRIENHYKLVSVYGCSECINAAYHVVDDCTQKYMLGKPNAFMNFKIDKKDSADGISGELLLSGPMVALGYLNSPELEKKKFIFEKGARWYRTGDKVRLMPNGEYKYVSRLDKMIKIGDYRIELAEIEHAILGNKEIKQVCVCIKEIMGKRSICAYYISCGGKSVNLHEFLSDVLPEYMIPSYFMNVQAIPVNSSGKFDESKLPLPNVQRNIFVSPRTEKEQTLIECISRIIPNITKIGIYDNYKDIGGDSLDALRIKTELREKGYEVSTYDIINSGSFSELCTGISQVLTPNNTAYDNQGIQFDIPCNLWYLNSLNTTSILNGFIIPEFYFCKCRISYYVVKETAETLITKHEMLRATISSTCIAVGVKDLQTYFYVNEVNLDVDVKKDPNKLEKQIEHLYSTININEGPIYVLSLIHAKDCDYILTAYSHLIADNFSKTILAQDFMSTISCLMRKADVHLPIVSDEYRLYCSATNKHFSPNETKLLPKKITDAKYETLHITLKEDFCSCINSKIKNYRIDIESIFSYIIIRCWNTIYMENSENFLLYMHGRDLNKSDLAFDRTVGFFVSYCIVELGHSEELNLIDDIRYLKRRIHEAKKNNVLKSKLLNLPKIGINYLGEIKNVEKDNDVVGVASYVPKYNYTPNNLNMYTPVTIFIIKQEKSIELQIRYNSRTYCKQEIANVLKEVRRECSNILNLQ